MPNRRVFFALPAALLLAGCSHGEPGRQPGAAAAKPPTAAAPGGSSGSGTLKVGLLTAGSLTDSGWNSLAGKGLEQLHARLGAVTGNQSSGAAQAEEALRGFARDGCNLIFAHGHEFGDAAKRVAEEYPKTYFVVSSGEVQGANVASLKFDLGEAAYLAGMAAAGLSRTGKAGQIGGESFPAVKEAFALFEKGGKAVNPRFAATTTYLGNWNDANQAKEQALAIYRSGADVIFQNADAAGEGVFQAAAESKDRGAFVIGSNADQNELKPDLIAASAVIDVPRTFLTIAQAVQAGTFKGGTYQENLKSGNIYLAVNPRFEKRLPESVKKQIRLAETEIKSGKLKLAAAK